MKVLQVEDIEKSKKRKKILKGLSFPVDEQEIVRTFRTKWERKIDYNKMHQWII